MADKRHPYIIGLLHSFQDEAHLYLVMDFIGGGDLFSLIEKKRRLPEAWARIYSAEIALALEHLHGHGVIYRDLKPENVMVGITGHLKLTDFGFAKKMNSTSLARGSCEYPEPYQALETWRTLPAQETANQRRLGARARGGSDASHAAATRRASPLASDCCRVP